MKSFSLLRTNVSLTTNIEIVVSSDDKLYMESIDSNENLSDDKFKKRQFPIDATYDQLIPTFYKDTPKEYAYHVKYDNDNKYMFKDYSKQSDDIYQSGCSNVTNMDYNEEFECFAPLHFNRKEFPRSFVIFRVDGPGLLRLDKDNFKEEIIDQLKCVSVYDLSNKSNVGQWIKKSFKDDETFSHFKFNLDVRSDEFSEWGGIDYETGGYTSKSLFMKDILKSETSFFELDKLITDNFKNLKLVYPNIINFKFLFDDTPATKTSLRKWSINRYYGFYVDSMDLVKCITPYSPPKLVNNVEVGDDNILSSPNGYPFDKDFKKGETFVEYFGQFYEVIKNGNEYKIISPFKLKGKGHLLNKEIISIDENNKIKYDTKYNSDIFNIKCFNDADVWLIEIDGKYHSIKNENGEFYIHTDYGFNINNNKLEYWINDSDPSFKTTINLNLVDSNNIPMTFNIFKLKFTDIKDFDTNVINTGYAKYEYENRDIISPTNSYAEEPKIFAKNENSKTNPKEFNEYIFKNELVKIPTSSEYVGTSEIFEIEENGGISDLTELWRKNPTFCKWGFEGSLSNGDYPYRLNNNFYGEDMNRSTNVYDPLPNRMERNLDYFYSINPDSLDYIDHTLHVSMYDEFGELDPNATFEIDKYFNVGTVSTYCCGETFSGTYSNNYFDYLFTKKEHLDNNNLHRNTNKYSIFQNGDNTIPNTTVFRGMKFKLYDVDKVLMNIDQSGKSNIDSISLLPANKYDGWKFSILLSDFKYDIDDPTFRENPTEIERDLEWFIINNWEISKRYPPDTIVMWYDILFANIEETSSSPCSSMEWIILNVDSILWNPNINYNDGDWVYNSGEYYRYINPPKGVEFIINFYNPCRSYNTGETVIYNNNYYHSTTDNNNSNPLGSGWEPGIGSGYSVWEIVEGWDKDKTYNESNIVIYNGSLYESTTYDNINNVPTIGSWKVIHSLDPNMNNYILNGRNDLYRLDNKYYMNQDINYGDRGAYGIGSESNFDGFSNGINIYINKKWKNVLVNIYINDNTIPNLSNSNRDKLYENNVQKLTAKNFIDAINDMDNRRGFANYINYYIIEEDLSYVRYNIDNVTELPTMLVVEDPDDFDVLIDSLERTPVNLDENLINAKFKLNNNELNNINHLNYYNNNPIAIKLDKVKDSNINKLTKKAKVYRFNGNYSPIFKDINLFERPNLCNSQYGNYKFDTQLSDFGIMTERVISKVNLNEDVLKLKDSTSLESIYPQLDEFGYTFTDHFIFKSTWDKDFYVKVNK